MSAVVSNMGKINKRHKIKVKYKKKLANMQVLCGIFHTSENFQPLSNQMTQNMAKIFFCEQ